MSNKNTKSRHKKDNGYPLPEGTVLFSRKKRMQPVPEVGMKYHCFDDGKKTFSRHYIIEVTEVLGHNAFKRKYPEIFKKYLQTTKEHEWLYSRSTDKFIITNPGENNELGVFVRTKDGGWFGIGDLFNCGEIDVTGKIWNYLVEHIDDFDLTQEDKERIVRENKIENEKP